MPRQRLIAPTYRLHRQSGQAVSDFYDPVTGIKRMISLGKYGSAESKKEHARLAAAVAAGKSSASDSITVSELCLAFLKHAKSYYLLPSGRPSNEIENYKQVLRLLRETHSETPASSFGPIALKAVRNRMVELGWSRKSINRQVSRIRKIIKFGIENELVPPATLEALRAVAGLQAGRSQAKESPPVLPVSSEIVEQTLPHVNRYIRGMIKFQRLTGCRPAEVCDLRRIDVDTSNPDVWRFTPPHHKLAHQGRKRTIFIGPQAQALLNEYSTETLEEFIFSPRKELMERNALRAATRETKYYESRQGWQKRKENPKRVPGPKYTTASYGYAIRRACSKHGIAPWHPNQLRHLRATEIRSQFGLEAAQHTLGHSKADTTQIYALRDEAKAIEAARLSG